MTVIRFQLKKILLTSFVALGPLGNILTPHFFPDSFRAYYFLLPFFPFFFPFFRERLFKFGGFLLPFLIYCYLSATLVEKFGSANEPHTVFRFFLLFCQSFFVIGAASCLKEKGEISQILKTYLMFYFISLFIGYVFFFGFYLKVIPLSIIARFSILVQFGFGILRFSPGSYPNEYGIVSSFVLSILLLMFLEKNSSHFSKKWLIFFLVFTFLAFLLTTTRAAYLSFLINLLYLTWSSGRFWKHLFYASLLITFFFGILALFHFNMFQVLSTGFTQRINEGSLGERYAMWQEGLEKAEGHSFWGAGFGSLTNIHNVYLQLFFELGVVGSLMLFVALFLILVEAYLKYRRRQMQDKASILFKKIRIVGLIHVLSFAASNHNLNHHLTWFVFFLCFASLRPMLSRDEKSLHTASAT